MYKKLFLILSILLFSFIAINNNVYAEEHVLANSTNSETCDYILGSLNDKNSFAYFLQQIFNIFKYGGPLLCIILSTLDFVKALSSQDKDFLMKATTRTGKRIILALILFFIPLLINFLFGIFGWTGTCGIS